MKTMLVTGLVCCFGTFACGEMVLSGPYYDGEDTFRLIVSGLGSDANELGISGGVYVSYENPFSNVRHISAVALESAGNLGSVTHHQDTSSNGWDFSVGSLVPQSPEQEVQDGDWIVLTYTWFQKYYWRLAAFALYDYSVSEQEPVQMLTVTGAPDPGPCYTGPDYDEWVAVGQPASWCNPMQCHGEATFAAETAGCKCTHFVSYHDISVLLDGFKKYYPMSPPPTAPDFTHPWIAADFDHAPEVIGKGTYRVGYNDINVLLNWFKVKPVPDDCLTESPATSPWEMN